MEKRRGKCSFVVKEGNFTLESRGLKGGSGGGIGCYLKEGTSRRGAKVSQRARTKRRTFRLEEVPVTLTGGGS